MCGVRIAKIKFQLHITNKSPDLDAARSPLATHVHGEGEGVCSAKGSPHAAAQRSPLVDTLGSPTINPEGSPHTSAEGFSREGQRDPMPLYQASDDTPMFGEAEARAYWCRRSVVTSFVFLVKKRFKMKLREVGSLPFYKGLLNSSRWVEDRT